MGGGGKCALRAVQPYRLPPPPCKNLIKRASLTTHHVVAEVVVVGVRLGVRQVDGQAAILLHQLLADARLVLGRNLLAQPANPDELKFVADLTGAKASWAADEPAGYVNAKFCRHTRGI
jgi:hypothetical protein